MQPGADLAQKPWQNGKATGYLSSDCENDHAMSFPISLYEGLICHDLSVGFPAPPLRESGELEIVEFFGWRLRQHGVLAYHTKFTAIHNLRLAVHTIT